MLVLRRLIAAVPTLLGITVISFLLILAAPGDPVTRLTFTPNATPEGLAQQRRLLGLDQPPLTQYVYWLIGNDFTEIDVNADGTPDVQGSRHGLLRGDLGQSITYKRPVLDLIVERIPATLRLTVPSFVIIYGLGITIGLLSAVNHNGWFDQLARIVSVLGTVVPSFWLALILIIVFSVQLGWLPLTGMRDVKGSVERHGDVVLPVRVSIRRGKGYFAVFEYYGHAAHKAGLFGYAFKRFCKNILHHAVLSLLNITYTILFYGPFSNVVFDICTAM